MGHMMAAIASVWLLSKKVAFCKLEPKCVLKPGNDGPKFIVLDTCFRDSVEGSCDIKEWFKACKPGKLLMQEYSLAGCIM
jgi:hypothetical protein